MDIVKLRRVALKEYVDLLKVVDIKERFDEEMCLEILDCYQEFKF